MSNRIPEYLKLHVEETDQAGSIILPEFSRLCDSFSAVAGFQLAIESRVASNQLTFPWADSDTVTYQVSLLPDAGSSAKKATRHERLELSESLGELLNTLSVTRHALRRREAELASSIPVISVDEDGQHLADRLEAVLRGSADMLRCFGAGLYLLDDATTSLKLRAQFGLDGASFLAPARRLEDSIADIEALAGHAVVIDDVEPLTHWNVPEVCGSAMCVPISSPTTILGTLWFYREHPSGFLPTEQNLAEMTAGRLASDMERGILLQEIRETRGMTPSTDPGPWTKLRKSRVTPVVDGWEVAEAYTLKESAGDFCHWYAAQEDKLHLSVGAAHGFVDKQLSSVAFQSSHAAHVQHDPSVKELFRKVNQSLWSSATDGDTGSLFHAKLDPTCGALDYGLAGGVFAYLIRPHGWEPLIAESSVLGENDDYRLETRHQILMPGDLLLAMSSPETSRQYERDNQMNQIAELLLRNTHLGVNELARMATDGMRKRLGDTDNLAVLIARRNEAKI